MEVVKTMRTEAAVNGDERTSAVNTPAPCLGALEGALCLKALCHWL